MKRSVVRSTPYRILPGGTFGKNVNALPDAVHVDADELEPAMALTRQRFEAKLAACETTFYLEPRDQGGDEFQAYAADPEHLYAESTLRALERIPFPCLRIVQTISCEDVGPVESEVICFGDGVTSFGWLARDRQIRNGVTAYSPTDVGGIGHIMPMAYLYLMEVLDSTTARYEPRPVSRQVRRASGFAESYSEFIVLRKPTKEQRKTALRRGEVFRRHPRLHAVRGHLVHYRSERYTKARGTVGIKGPFVRGHGAMLQVKDYREG